MPKGALGELHQSKVPVVTEYAVWAIYRDQFGTIADVQIDPLEAFSLPENVRRWYWRLLVKQPKNLAVYQDTVLAAMNDLSPAAREGLALGFTYWPGVEMAVQLIAWSLREDDSLVSSALGRHFERFRQRDDRYNELTTARERRELAQGLPGTEEERTGRSLFSRRRTPRQKEALMPEVPSIANAVDEHVYVLAVDTVGFSQLADSRQIEIFSQILGVIAREDTARRLPAGDVVSLLTGDGVILAIRGASNRHSPLSIALAVRDLLRETVKWKVRYGIHDGPAHWITMTDGSRQLIGHTINFSARVMTAAEPNQVLVSKTYFDTNVRSQTDRFPGTSFVEVPELKTKHGEPIEALSAQRS